MTVRCGRQRIRHGPKATVDSDRAATETVVVQRSYTSIVSPITGRIGMRRVDPGNLVQANDPNGLFSVVQIDPISVVFSVPQQELSRLQPLLANPSGAQAIASDRDAGTTLATGHLTNIDNQIDSTTGTIQLRAQFPNPEGRLWSGQFVTVQLQTGMERGAAVVNSRAVQDGLDGHFVFRVKNRAVEVVPIEVGYVQGALTTVAAGLKPGDVVVMEGQERLTAGTPVEVSATEDRESEPSRPEGGIRVEKN